MHGPLGQEPGHDAVRRAVRRIVSEHISSRSAAAPARAPRARGRRSSRALRPAVRTPRHRSCRRTQFGAVWVVRLSFPLAVTLSLPPARSGIESAAGSPNGLKRDAGAPICKGPGTPVGGFGATGPAIPAGQTSILLTGGCGHGRFRFFSPVPLDDRLRSSDAPRGCRTRVDSGASYPPYNIEVTGENAYRLTMAVAGFSAGRPRHHRQGERAPGQRPVQEGRAARNISTTAWRGAPSSGASSSPTISR